MRADWQQTAKTVLVMWPLRSVSAKRSFSTVVTEKSPGLGATSFVDMLESPGFASLLVIVVPSHSLRLRLETISGSVLTVGMPAQ